MTEHRAQSTPFPGNTGALTEHERKEDAEIEPRSDSSEGGEQPFSEDGSDAASEEERFREINLGSEEERQQSLSQWQVFVEFVEDVVGYLRYDVCGTADDDQSTTSAVTTNNKHPVRRTLRTMVLFTVAAAVLTFGGPLALMLSAVPLGIAVLDWVGNARLSQWPWWGRALLAFCFTAAIALLFCSFPWAAPVIVAPKLVSNLIVYLYAYGIHWNGLSALGMGIHFQLSITAMQTLLSYATNSAYCVAFVAGVSATLSTLAELVVYELPRALLACLSAGHTTPTQPAEKATDDQRLVATPPTSPAHGSGDKYRASRRPFVKDRNEPTRTRRTGLFADVSLRDSDSDDDDNPFKSNDEVFKEDKRIGGNPYGFLTPPSSLRLKDSPHSPQGSSTSSHSNRADRADDDGEEENVFLPLPSPTSAFV